MSSLPRCDQCNSLVTDSIEIEIESHGRVKLAKNIQGTWICDDCMLKRDSREKHIATSAIQDDNKNNVHHEDMGDASKSDVSPNTPTAEEVDL